MLAAAAIAAPTGAALALVIANLLLASAEFDMEAVYLSEPTAGYRHGSGRWRSSSCIRLEVKRD